MKQLLCASPKEAEARSQAEWEKRLGRPVREGDVTRFLWATDGAAVLVPDEDEARLTKAESLSLRSAEIVLEGAVKGEG